MSIAAQSVFDKMAQGFKEYVSEQAVVLLVIVLGLSMVILGGLALRSYLHDRRERAPAARGLFREICMAHQLTNREIRILKRITKHYELQDPAMIFVRRSLFESGIEIAQGDAAEIDLLRRKLYSP